MIRQRPTTLTVRGDDYLWEDSVMRHRHRLPLSSLVAAALAAALLAAPVAAGSRLTASLTGASEVPGPGDPDGSGTAVVRANGGKGIVCYELTVSGIAPATAAHIHVGSVGVAGPVVVPLQAPTTGSSSGCIEVVRSLARAIASSPEDHYVNVHNSEYPAGAVRGQLSK
jgi:hypothetical protein